MIETRERILDAAERLIARNGIGATSLRAIIAEAGVNLAAVHYHFGSKEALVSEVARRRIGPVNSERLAMLDRAKREAGKKGPSLEKVVEAFVAPVVRLQDVPERGEMFASLMGRLLADPTYFYRWILPQQFAEVRDRFVAAIEKAVPNLPRQEAMWRLMFAIGALAHMMRSWNDMPAFSDGVCGKSSVAKNSRRLVAFVAAGLRAPVERRVK
jgi:AcrR family transcriptional regulator